MKKLKRIWDTIVLKIKTRKAWEKIAPIGALEPKINLNDRLQIKIIIAAIEKGYLNAEGIEDDDIEFREGIKLYSLNDKVIRVLTIKGYTLYRNKREFYKAQGYELL